MATSVSFVVARVATILMDEGHDRWTLDDLVDYLNEAQNATVVKLPKANIVTDTITLVAGAAQSIPADGIMVAAVTRNYTGTTPGDYIRKVDFGVLDQLDPDWQNATGAAPVLEYGYDPEDPTVFYVNPPQPGTPTEVEIKYSAVPTIVNPGEDLVLRDEYVNSIIEYMLFRAFSRDAEYVQPGGRADKHYEKFVSELPA